MFSRGDQTVTKGQAMKARQFLAVLVLALVCVASAPVTASQPFSHEVVTFDATAGGVGFTAATIRSASTGKLAESCVGVLETAAIRYTEDGDTVTSSNGRPVAVGGVVTITGYQALRQFKGIRTTGTSGAIYFTCYAQ